MPRIFNGTYRYYAKYRPGIPEKVINLIVKYFDLKLGDRVLDIGCGTGQIAIAMDGRCKEMVCLDSDPKMIEQGKKRMKGSKTKLVWINKGSQDLGKIRKELGIFKLAIISRAFHWMDQKQVLKDLEEIISEDGGIAILGDKSLWTGREKWQKAVKRIIQKYLGKERRAGEGAFKQSDESWEDLIAKSAFRFVKTNNIPVVREWGVESVIGWLFSSSFASPDYFGNRLNAFKEDIEKTLLAINPKGVFRETAIWTIILASKKTPK